MTLHMDEQPTEMIPVVPEEAHDQDEYGGHDQYEGRDEYDDFLDDGFSQPRQRSRMTTALVALLLVAIGFLGGVVVERSYGVSNAGTGRANGGGATVSGTARPPAGSGGLARL
jgi:hypothetical protein